MKDYKTAKRKGAWEREMCNYLSGIYKEGFIQAAYERGSFTNIFKEMTILDDDGEEIQYFPRGNILPPLNWKYMRFITKMFQDWRFHAVFTNSYHQLDRWIQDLYTDLPPGEITLIIIQVSRYGGFVIYPEKYGFDLTGQSYHRYYSKKFGAWIMCPIDPFFKKNKKRIKEIGINGLFLEENQNG